MPIGTEIIAGKAGEVIHVEDGHSDDGAQWPCHGVRSNSVSVRHSDGSIAQYIHLTRGLAVKAGDRVLKGQLLGFSGNSGCSSGPHLHIHALTSNFLRSIPIRFTFPCSNVKDSTLTKGQFLCNDANCECKSTMCAPWPTDQFRSAWQQFCSSAGTKVWAMSRTCSAAWFRTGGDLNRLEVDTTADCERVAQRECTVFANDNSMCK